MNDHRSSEVTTDRFICPVLGYLINGKECADRERFAACGAPGACIPIAACTACGGPIPGSEAAAGFTTCEFCDRFPGVKEGI
ncbi:MAG: hypothetical protein HY883_03620 [Deltaproteobacteria bacterium]|nr:hypothetical protein [Deltaproteobacteria bacterium]